MLSIARALLLNPKVLILDEPSQGLAPLIVKDVFRIVASMREQERARDGQHLLLAAGKLPAEIALALGEAWEQL